jgi:hypothetical protein
MRVKIALTLHLIEMAAGSSAGNSFLGKIAVSLTSRRAGTDRRQDAPKSRAVLGVVGRLYPPLMGFNDRATDRQSHAHPVGLRAEERIEQSICIFRADPGA